MGDISGAIGVEVESQIEDMVFSRRSITNFDIVKSAICGEREIT